MIPVTSKQKLFLQKIADYSAAHGYAPSIRELMNLCGLRSTNGANDHIKALERRGLVVRDPNVARSMRITVAGLLLLEGNPRRLRQGDHCALCGPTYTGRLGPFVRMDGGPLDGELICHPCIKNLGGKVEGRS